MSEKVNQRAITHENKNTHFLVRQNSKSIFPQNIYWTREPIRDLADFSKHIHRTREPIRDLENAIFQDLKNPKQVFPKSVGELFQHLFSILGP